MAEQQIAYPTSAYGQTEAWKRTGTFYNGSGSDILAKRGVIYDGTTVTLAATNAPPIAVIGVTYEAIPNGKVGQVLLEGKMVSMPATGAIAQYALVKRSTGTAGFVEDATANPALGEVIGHALQAAAGGFVDVWINKGYGDAA